MEDAAVSPLEILSEYLAGKGLKLTGQRKAVLEAFLDSEGHVTAEHVYDRVKRRNPTIGQATVYRAMKVLTEAGIAREVRLGDGLSRYERARGREHHDHLVCESCRAQVEFTEPVIEEMQKRTAAERGFTLTSHRMVLYGICPRCREGREG